MRYRIMTVTAVAAALACGAPAASAQDSCDESVSMGFESGSASLDFVARELLDSARDQAIDDQGRTRAHVRIVTNIDSVERARGLTALDQARGEAIRTAFRAMPGTSRWSYQIVGMDDRAPKVPSSGSEPNNRRAVIFFCEAG